MLSTIQDILSKRGEDFLNKLFNYNLKVYEKLNGSFFSFYWNGEKFTFLKKDGTEITKTDRLINRYWEDAIIYINSLTEETKLNLFKNSKYVFEYFPNNSPNYIEYDIIPKNKLVLLYLEKRENSKIIKISDEEILEDQATFLNVSVNKVIFNGKMKPEQKEKVLNIIKDYKDTDEDKILSQVIKVLNPEVNNTLLNKDLSKSIESLIFEFEDKQGREKYFAKMIDPYFQELVSMKKQNLEVNDFVKLINSKILEFVSLNIKPLFYFQFKSKEKDERFNELIFHLFNEYVTKNFDKLETVDLRTHLPEFLNKKEFKINKDLISNDQTLDLIELNSNYEEILKLFILLFRKNKKNKEEFLNPNSITIQNELFSEIQKLCRIKVYESIVNDEIIFPYKDTEEIYIDKSKNNENPEDFIKKTYFDIEEEDDKKRKSLVTFKSILKKNNSKSTKDKIGINLVIDDYSFITKEQINFIKETFSNKNPVTLIHLSKDNIFDLKFIKDNLEKVKLKLDKTISEVFTTNSLNTTLQEILTTKSLKKIWAQEQINQYIGLILDHIQENNSEIEYNKITEDKSKNKTFLNLLKDYSYTSFKKEMYFIFVDELDSFKNNLNEQFIFEEGEGMTSIGSVNGMGSVTPPTINSIGSGDRFDNNSSHSSSNNMELDPSDDSKRDKGMVDYRKKKSKRNKKSKQDKKKRPFKKSSLIIKEDIEEQIIDNNQLS